MEFAAGTLVAGDTIAFRCDAPQWNTTELTAALTALKEYDGEWAELQIVGNIDATAFDAIETAFTAMAALGKYRTWHGGVRMRNLGVPGDTDETRAEYVTALNTIFSSISLVAL